MFEDLYAIARDYGLLNFGNSEMTGLAEFLLEYILAIFGSKLMSCHTQFQKLTLWSGWVTRTLSYFQMAYLVYSTITS